MGWKPGTVFCMALMKYNDFNDELIIQFHIAPKENDAMVSTHEVKEIITSSGFDAPVLFCQTLLIHAWYTRRAG